MRSERVQASALGGFKSLCVLGLLWLAALSATAQRAEAACPNEAFRIGPSASLPDCRAYELITPPDSDGRLIANLTANIPNDIFPMELASPNGSSVVFKTFGTPLHAPGGAIGTADVYGAVRSSAGWRTIRRLSPSGTQAIETNGGGISPDHSHSFTHVEKKPEEDSGSLAAEGSADYLTNPDGSFELVGVGTLGTERLAQGRFISEEGNHIVFATGGSWCAGCQIKQLEPNAPPTGTPAIYDRSADGPTHVVSLLPGDVTPKAGESAQYQGTSSDGSAVAFKISNNNLYVRANNSVTEKVAGGPATFAGISASGDRVFYVKGGNIFAFDVSSEETKQLTTSADAEPVNISADGSHVYFVSPSILDAPKGTEGKPNLYVWSASEELVSFVATVSPKDTEGLLALNNWTSWAVNPEGGRGPGRDPSQTTPDGEVLVFQSHAQLTSYDNQGHSEIYRYATGPESIQCVSCNPNNESALADARLEALNFQSFLLPELGGAAMVVHNVSDDGSRVFFETAEALSSEDINGINDIYEWHKGGEEEALDLISSGEGVEYPPLAEGLGYIPRPNTIFSITPDGSNVVFLSLEPLVPGAPEGGATALYDARIDGGFSAPPTETVCMGIDECRGPASSLTSVPIPSAPVSQGNVQRKKVRCRRIHPRHRTSGRRHSCHRHKHKGGQK